MDGLRDTDRDTAKEMYLRTHIEEHYGVHIQGLHRLDKGVFNADLRDGRRWVVRVFPERRLIEQVEGDATILRFLEQQGFPAERCAGAAPVSVLRGRGILITEFVEGAQPEANEPTLHAYGEMLGRLSMLPVEGAAARKAGALHHYAQGGGGPEDELIAAAAWLAEIEDRVPRGGRARYEALRERVANADTCRDLPEALIHPDPVLKNMLATHGSGVVLIDWTGAGCGPRVASLAVFIWSCALTEGSWSPVRVDAAVAGYRSSIQLTENELARLGAVMRIRPLVFACWRYRHATLAERPPNGSEWWWPSDELAEAVAASASAAFQS